MSEQFDGGTTNPFFAAFFVAVLVVVLGGAGLILAKPDMLDSFFGAEPLVNKEQSCEHAFSYSIKRDMHSQWMDLCRELPDTFVQCMGENRRYCARTHGISEELVQQVNRFIDSSRPQI